MGEYRVEILEILKRRAAPTRHPRRHPFRGVSPPLRRIRHPDRLKSDATKLFLSGEIRRRVLSPFHEPSVEISYPPPPPSIPRMEMFLVYSSLLAITIKNNQLYGRLMRKLTRDRSN